jgi:hypothetical protein
MSDDEIRRMLLDLARRLFGPGPDPVTVFAVRGEVELVQQQQPATPPGQVPEGMSAYDAAIVRALGDRAMTSERLARAAGHRHNSYFRTRLAALVESGHVRHTRRGYGLPDR